MSAEITGVIIAVVSLVGTLSGSYFSQRKTTALVLYRMEQLEDKVHLHNNLIERTYKLEEKCTVQDEKLSVVNHRISDLEKEK